ncbi:MAG: ATP-dependent helicase [Armatimonadota bacterium]|nr:ATP-dependent helicase [Armatimonadota bacterium]MDR7543044.1 ATP-dependent helicase [Armatimonadota bacterium]
MAWDDNLSEEQRRAAAHVGSHARVLAGPGTGKTLALTRRVVHLVSVRGVDPDRIMVLTFTRAATAELKRRIRAELTDEAGRVLVSTLHSFALRMILQQGAGTRLPAPVRIADDFEERWIIEEDLKELLGLPRVQKARELLKLLSADWERLAADDPGYEPRFPNPRFLGAWREHRAVFGYTLRAELVYQLKHALEEGSIAMSRPPLHILVDEYQDLNACDLAVINRLTSTGAELYVAGDDDQSIYGFRFANPEGIRRFHHDYVPSTPLNLEECRRCDSRILDVALYVAEQDPRREPKRLFAAAGAGTGEVRILGFTDQTEEAIGIGRLCRWLVGSRGIAPYQILILLRSDRNRVFSDPVRKALEREGLPVATVSDPLEPLEVEQGREFLSILRLVVNPMDHLAWRTLLQLRNNGVGDQALRGLYELARKEGRGFAGAVEAVTANPSMLGRLGTRVAQDATSIATTIGKAAGRRNGDLARYVEDLAGVHVADPELRSRVVALFRRVLSASPTDDLAHLLRAINVSLDDVEQEIDAGAINIMTMHQAKGLSADAVVVMAAEDEYIPGRATGDTEGDERRLLYVSLTRARHYLYVTHCQRRTGAQAHTGRIPGQIRRTLTRFLSGGPILSAPGANYIDTLR